MPTKAERLAAEAEALESAALNNIKHEPRPIQLGEQLQNGSHQFGPREFSELVAQLCRAESLLPNTRVFSMVLTVANQRQQPIWVTFDRPLVESANDYRVRVARYLRACSQEQLQQLQSSLKQGSLPTQERRAPEPEPVRTGRDPEACDVAELTQFMPPRTGMPPRSAPPPQADRPQPFPRVESAGMRGAIEMGRQQLQAPTPDDDQPLPPREEKPFNITWSKGGVVEVPVGEAKPPSQASFGEDTSRPVVEVLKDAQALAQAVPVDQLPVGWRGALPITLISRFKEQPRQYFEPAALTSLSLDMDTGQNVPALIVHRSALGEHAAEYDTPFVLCDGERRWRARWETATRRAVVPELITLEVEIKHVSSIEELFAISTSANGQRREMLPLEEAEAFVRLRERSGYNDTKISQMAGRSVTYVYNMRAVANLPAAVKAYLSPERAKEQRISVTAAIYIALRLKDPAVQLRAAQRNATQQMPLADFKLLVDEWADGSVGTGAAPRRKARPSERSSGMDKWLRATVAQAIRFAGYDLEEVYLSNENNTRFMIQQHIDLLLKLEEKLRTWRQALESIRTGERR